MVTEREIDTVLLKIAGSVSEGVPIKTGDLRVSADIITEAAKQGLVLFGADVGSVVLSPLGVQRVSQCPKHIVKLGIEGFRGIRGGELDDLSPLTILVGPNSAGKSSVLEALFLSLVENPDTGLLHCIRRRRDLVEGARWLFFSDTTPQRMTVQAFHYGGVGRRLSVVPHPLGRGQGWQATLEVTESYLDTRRGLLSRTINLPQAFQGELPQTPGIASLVPQTRLIESQGTLPGISLPDRLAEATERGLRRAVVDLLKEILPETQSIETLTAAGVPYVGVVTEDSAIPLGTLGDGVQLLVRQCLELAAPQGSLALLEEPEAHKHPGAVQATAKAIVWAVKRDIQVILSTHSLELVDDLINEADEETLKKMVLFRLNLKRGELRSSRLGGEAIRSLRSDIQEDLR